MAHVGTRARASIMTLSHDYEIAIQKKRWKQSVAKRRGSELAQSSPCTLVKFEHVAILPMPVAKQLRSNSIVPKCWTDLGSFLAVQLVDVQAGRSPARSAQALLPSQSERPKQQPSQGH